MLPTVTIAVLNHNYEKFVGEAIESTIGQLPGDYLLDEIVVIDDGSTDRSQDVYASFEGIRVVNQPNQGFGGALTRAVTESRSDWLALCDADDAFEPEKLRVVARELTRPDVGLIQHCELVVDANGNPYGEGTHPGGATSTLLIRTEFARDLLPVTNELFFHVLADVGRGVAIRDPLTRYRVHDASMTDRHTPGAFAAYMAGICNDIAERLADLCQTPKAWATQLQLEVLADTYRQRAADHFAESRRQIRRGAIR